MKGFSQYNLITRPYSDLLAELDKHLGIEQELWSDENNYYFSLDVPGARQEDIKIEIQDNTLSIDAERKKVGLIDNQAFYHRTFTIPSGVRSDEIEAHLENGVLEVTLPKEPGSQSRRIEVTSESTKQRIDAASKPRAS